jgi:hypothetical protein
MPEEDLHLSDHTRSQAHIPSALAAWSLSFCLQEFTSTAIDTIGFSRMEFQFLPALSKQSLG